MSAAPFEPWATVFVTLFGLVLGSFLNVCIARLPRGESVVRPRSRCPRCGTQLAARHNVPVLSWVLLRGRCASCGGRISLRYPLVEILTAAMLAGLWRLLGPSPGFVVAAVFASMLLVLFFTDLDHRLLPDKITLTGFGAGVALAWINPFLGPEEPWRRMVMSLGGALLGAGLLWSVGAVYERLRGVEAMGLGDVKLMAMVGAFTGPAGVLFTLFVGSVAGAVVGVARIPLRGGSLQDMLPFGCFLAPAALAALLVGRRALDAYWTWVRGGLGGP